MVIEKKTSARAVRGVVIVVIVVIETNRPRFAVL